MIGDQQVTIFLDNGAEFYSLDNSFNQQIIQKKIVLKNAVVSSKNRDNAEILITSVNKCPEKQNLSHQISNFKEQKRRELLKQIKEKINIHEARSRSFAKLNYKNYPSSSRLYSLFFTSRIYITTAHNKFISRRSCNKDYSINCALDDLHNQQYTFYNNKSLDFCFSEFFFVRPPPILLS
nr:hypothetical protein [uncultured Chryseobacterium sp.]